METQKETTPAIKRILANVSLELTHIYQGNGEICLWKQAQWSHGVDWATSLIQFAIPSWWMWHSNENMGYVGLLIQKNQQVQGFTTGSRVVFNDP